MDLRAASPTYARTLDQIDAAMESFLSTGFVVFQDPQIDPAWDYAKRRRVYREQAPPLGNVYVRKLVRKTARELKRPIVIAETTYWSDKNGVTKVTVRKLKRNAPLISQFLLLEAVDRDWQMFDKHNKATVVRRQNTANWYIAFKGRKGQIAFRQWMAACIADPEYRKLFKLPPLEEAVKPAA